MPEQLLVTHLEDVLDGRFHPRGRQHSKTLHCKLSGGVFDLMEQTHNSYFNNTILLKKQFAFFFKDYHFKIPQCSQNIQFVLVL